MRRSYLTLVAVCTFWGTIPLVARRIDLAAPAIVFVRVWVAAAGLVVVLATEGWRGRPGNAGARRSATWTTGRLRHAPLRALGAGLLLAVHWTTMFAAYALAPDDTVVFVVFLAPVGVALVAPRILGETVGRRVLAALALAVAGFVLVAGPSLRASSGTGIAMAAVSSVTFVFLIVLSKPLAEALGGLRLTLVEMVVAGVLLLPVALTADWQAPASAWAWLVVLGLAHTAVGISLYLGALARVPATSAGIFGYLEPFSVVALSWLLLSETPRLTTILGGVLIVGAGAVVLAAADPAAPHPSPARPASPGTEVPAHAAG